MRLIGAGTGLSQLIREELRAEPFTLVDIGCSGGIDREWRAFEPHFRALGVDPNIKECERLSKDETNERVRYFNGFVEWDKTSDFAKGQGDAGFFLRSPFYRLAVSQTMDIRSAKAFTHEQLTLENNWHGVPLSPQRVRMPFLLENFALGDIDFIKIDVDGPDFLILDSMRDEFAKRRVIGLIMEVNFFGGDDPREHTFHNTDRFMRSLGFELFGLTQRFYSLQALPQRYELSVPGNSVRGRLFQGDAVYFRDMGNPQAEQPFPLTREKVLKLAALFDMFDKPDSSAEVLITHRDIIGDVDSLLDWLSDRSGVGISGGYKNHIEKFRQDDDIFYTK